MAAAAVLVLALGAHFSKAQTHSDAQDCDKNGNPDQRIRGCTRIINLSSDLQQRAIAYCNRGIGYSQKGDHNRAIADLNESIRLWPDNAKHYSNRGAAYIAKGDNDRAIVDYDQAILLKPDYTLAYMGRSLAYTNKGDYDRAIADSDEAILLKPDEVPAYITRGMSYDRKGDHDQAIANFDEAIRLKPDYLHAYQLRGLAYYKKGDDDRAIADYDEVIRLKPDDYNTYNSRASILLKKGRLTQAFGDIEQAIRLNPNDFDLLDTRGHILLALGRRDEAITDFTQAIGLGATQPQPFNGRGQAYEQTGRLNLALADYRRALQLDATDDEARQAQAIASQHLAEAPASISAPVTAPAMEERRPTTATVSISERRIALVIGNSAYRNVSSLPNAAADASAFAVALRRIGFAQVTEQRDLDLASLTAALKNFGDQAMNSDWAVIYYAGHGIEVDGRNYLIPVDAKIALAHHVEDETLPLDRVLAKAEAARKLRLVILDACRVNPFAARMAAGNRAIGRGLGRIEPGGGVLVAYAARDGRVAEDGADGHSPFTAALLKHLEEPGVDIGLLFRRVRDTVMADTRSQQEPFTYGSLPGEALYFRPPQ
jgi:tetratricopeptide (TPR) repeat protein